MVELISALRELVRARNAEETRDSAPTDQALRLLSSVTRWSTQKEEWVSEQWAAVAAAIDQRMVELGILQRDLAERAHVSQAIVRELQHNTAQRRRSARTLEALSTALGWHPRYLHAVLAGEKPPARAEATPLTDNEIAGQLAAIQSRLRSIEDRLDEVHAYLAKGDIDE